MRHEWFLPPPRGSRIRVSLEQWPSPRQQGLSGRLPSHLLLRVSASPSQSAPRRCIRVGGGWAGGQQQPLLVGAGSHICWHHSSLPTWTPHNDPEAAQFLTAWGAARTLPFVTPLARSDQILCPVFG